MLASDDIDAFIRDQHRREIRDQHRREAWKRLARQHHVDQAGCCTGESECPCPNCREYREFHRLRLGESLHKVHIGHDDGGKVVKWIWVRLPHGWRRKDIATQKFFGGTVPLRDHYPKRATGEAVHYIRTRTVGAASIKDEVIVYSTNPNSAENWVRSMFTDPPAKHDVGTPWAEPPRKDADLQSDTALRKETGTMTPYEMFILFSLHACPQMPLPKCTSEITHHAVASLLKAEMIKCEYQRVSGYALSERGWVYIAAISVLPLPIRQQAPWVMPEPQPQSGSRER